MENQTETPAKIVGANAVLIGGVIGILACIVFPYAHDRSSILWSSARYITEFMPTFILVLLVFTAAIVCAACAKAQTNRHEAAPMLGSAIVILSALLILWVGLELRHMQTISGVKAGFAPWVVIGASVIMLGGSLLVMASPSE